MITRLLISFGLMVFVGWVLIARSTGYKVGNCVQNWYVYKIVEETDDSYVIENQYERLMDKKGLIRRVFKPASCDGLLTQ